MHTIKPFQVRIIENYPEGKIVHNSTLDYTTNRLSEDLAKHPSYVCKNCKESHKSKSEFSLTCTYPVTTFCFDININSTNPSDYLIETLYTNPTGHDFKSVPEVKTELGDAVPCGEKRIQKVSNLLPHNIWYSSNISPINRGLLFSERESYGGKLHTQYKYYSRHILEGHIYRSPKIMNEKRQLASLTQEPIKPKIRAKRQLASLPDSHDDIKIGLRKSWKVAKVRKQWQVNL